jgi:hypothetical protein
VYSIDCDGAVRVNLAQCTHYDISEFCGDGLPYSVRDDWDDTPPALWRPDMPAHYQTSA